MKSKVVLLSALVFVSCSVEQVNQENENVNIFNETIKKLSLVNDSVKNNSSVILTRSLVDKLHKLASADVAGAKAAGEQFDKEVKPILENNPFYDESYYQEQKTKAMLAG